ncbi:MAG: type II secretion system protein [Eubacteriales bacterium]
MYLPINYKTKLQNKKGFTLVELIISVGILSLLGVLILLFFMSSKDVGLRTKELDQSVYHTNNIIESMKSEDWEKEPLNDFNILTLSNKKITLSSLYDDNWNLVHQEKKALFRTIITIDKSSENSEKSLYQISVKVIRLKAYFRSKKDNPLIHSIQTSLYIGNISEENLK